MAITSSLAIKVRLRFLTEVLIEQGRETAGVDFTVMIFTGHKREIRSRGASLLAARILNFDLTMEIVIAHLQLIEVLIIRHREEFDNLTIFWTVPTGICEKGRGCYGKARIRKIIPFVHLLKRFIPDAVR